MITITVNGEPLSLSSESSIDDVVAARCLSPRGIAVARNGEVVPRSSWSHQGLASGDAIEIVTAAAGG